MEIRTITEVGDWDDLAGPWNQLLSSSRSNHVYLTHEWLRTWWEVYGDGVDLAVVLAFEGDALIGVAPMCLQRAGKGPLGLKQLRFLGSQQVNSEFLDFFAAPGREDEILPLLLDALVQHFPFDRLTLHDMDSRAASIPIIEAWARQRRLPHATLFRFQCPYIPLPATVAEFTSHMDRAFYEGVKRTGLRRLDRDHHPEFIESVGADDLETYLQALFDLHTERWQASHVVGQFDTEEKRTFYRKLAHLLDDRGWLRLSALNVDGATDAVLFSIRYEDQFYPLQLGCGMTGREHKAGNVLFYRVFESLIGNTPLFHFLRGEETYKYKWGCEDNHTVNVYVGRSLKGRAWLLAQPLVRRAKRAATYVRTHLLAKRLQR